MTSHADALYLDASFLACLGEGWIGEGGVARVLDHCLYQSLLAFLLQPRGILLAILAPSQILQPIVGLITILMDYAGQVSLVGKECFCHQSVNHLLVLLAIVVEANPQISPWRLAKAYDVALLHTERSVVDDHPRMSPYPAVGGRLV